MISRAPPEIKDDETRQSLIDKDYIYLDIPEEGKNYVMLGLGFGADKDNCGPIYIRYKELKDDCSLGDVKLILINRKWNNERTDIFVGNDKENEIMTFFKASSTNGDTFNYLKVGGKLLKEK